MGDHTESLQVDYRPERVSYGELLRVFWERHDPTRQSPSRQYENVVLHHDPDQRRAIDRSLEEFGVPDAGSVATRIDSLDDFHRAEGYHQKYYLRNDSTLSQHVEGWSDREVADSPAAALLNARAAGHLEVEELRARSRELGLPGELARAVREDQRECSSR